jgi:acetolactate synthase-1/2/3 large subunit
MLNSTAIPIRPERLCKAITQALPENATLVSDTGHSGMWSGALIDFLRPGQRYIRCAGSLGWALPAAIGVKCADPSRPVICFAGDGAAYYHIAELETAARYGQRVVFVINNNSAVNQEIQLYREAYPDKPANHSDELWRFRDVNLSEVSKLMGCSGIRVKDPADLDDALHEALQTEGPVVVEVLTDINAEAKNAWRP